MTTLDGGAREPVLLRETRKGYVCVVFVPDARAVRGVCDGVNNNESALKPWRDSSPNRTPTGIRRRAAAISQFSGQRRNCRGVGALVRGIFAMLALVFKVHRFVAGGFGLSLLLAPEAVNKAFAPDRNMPVEEKLTLQSWAAFMIGVAGIVHAAINFPPAAQRSVAKSLLACFVIESMVYAKALANDIASAPLDYKIGFASTGAVFLALALAYGIALAQPVAKTA